MYKDIEYKIASKNKNIEELNYSLKKFDDNRFTYLLFPYYPEGDILDNIGNNFPISENDAKKYTKNILKCISKLNEFGYVHLDIKLDNFLVSQQKLVLTDFGSCNYIKHEIKMHPLYDKVGTEIYISPEVKNNFYHINSDSWSVGICMYHLLKGDVLYQNVNDYILEESKINIFSDDANDLLNSFLVKHPLDRISIVEAISHKWFENI